MDELLTRLLDEKRAFWQNVASTAGESYASEEAADLAVAEDAQLRAFSIERVRQDVPIDHLAAPEAFDQRRTVIRRLVGG